MSNYSKAESSNNFFSPHDSSNITSKFDDPFLVPSNEIIPEDLSNALELALFLYYLNPMYRRATQRVVRHFITHFKLPDAGDSDEKEEFRKYLSRDLELEAHLAECGDEWACYGNAFYRIHFPFNRYLEDKRNGGSKYYALHTFDYDDVKFILKEMVYEVPDPQNNFETKVKLNFVDVPNKDKNKIRLVKLDPRHVTIQHNYISKANTYLYLFDKQFENDVKDGVLYQVNETPKSMLNAIQQDKGFRFKNDAIFHFRAPTISGVSDHGWGFPETIANFRAIYQSQIYRKVDEIIALDYLLPFRIFSMPVQGSDNSMVNGMNSINSELWKHHVEKTIKTRRQDKTAMFAFPFPVNYQEFGADGKAFTPKDLLQYQEDYLLHSLGYPAELFRGSLQLQQVPTAIRLFENQFWFIHTNFNNFAKWVVRKIQIFLGKEPYDIYLERPSIADNIDRKNVMLQLGMQGELPRSQVYKLYGVDNAVESKKERLEEDIQIQKDEMALQEQAQREIEAEKALQNSINPSQGGEDSQISPMDIEAQAQALAAEWLGIQSDGERRQAMQTTRAQNENLYSLAKQYMEDMRQEGESQGRQQVYQQAQQQPAPPGGNIM